MPILDVDKKTKGAWPLKFAITRVGTQLVDVFEAVEERPRLKAEVFPDESAGLRKAPPHHCVPIGVRPHRHDPGRGIPPLVIPSFVIPTFGTHGP